MALNDNLKDLSENVKDVKEDIQEGLQGISFFKGKTKLVTIVAAVAAVGAAAYFLFF